MDDKVAEDVNDRGTNCRCCGIGSRKSVCSEQIS